MGDVYQSVSSWLTIDQDRASDPDIVHDLKVRHPGNTSELPQEGLPLFKVVYAVHCPTDVLRDANFLAQVRAWRPKLFVADNLLWAAYRHSRENKSTSKT